MTVTGVAVLLNSGSHWYLGCGRQGGMLAHSFADSKVLCETRYPSSPGTLCQRVPLTIVPSLNNAPAPSMVAVHSKILAKSAHLHSLKVQK